MSEPRQYDIDGYEELSRWNIREANALLVYDRVYVSVALAALGASVVVEDYRAAYPYVFAGSWLLLSFWVLLCWRFKIRYGQRFDIMAGIECKLGFSAHRAMRDKPNPMGEKIHEQHLRSGFYCITLVLAALASFLPDIRSKITVPCTNAFIFVPLGVSVLVGCVLSILSPATTKKNGLKEDNL